MACPLGLAGGAAATSAQELRGRLGASEKSFFQKFADRIAYVETLRPWFGFVAVVGALIAAVARAVPDPWGLGLVILGAVVGAGGGALVVLMDYRKLEIAQDAKDAHRIADDALVALEEGEGRVREALIQCDEAGSFDQKRLARIDGLRLMIESVSAAFLSGATPHQSAGKLLATAIAALRNAVDYRAGDFLTFTILQRQGKGSSMAMVPIAREWTDPHEAGTLGRSWKAGKGYTGHLWSVAKDNPAASLVEPDTQAPKAAQRYSVAGGDPQREARYRSVVSFPILVGSDNQIWGVVTATSDRAGVFDHTGDLPRQGVEAVRDVALVASLLANLRAN